MVSSQRELSTVQAQMKGRSREARVQELTMEQLQKLGPETRLYKAIGKMYVISPVWCGIFFRTNMQVYGTKLPGYYERGSKKTR